MGNDIIVFYDIVLKKFAVFKDWTEVMNLGGLKLALEKEGLIYDNSLNMKESLTVDIIKLYIKHLYYLLQTASHITKKNSYYVKFFHIVIKPNTPIGKLYKTYSEKLNYGFLFNGIYSVISKIFGSDLNQKYNALLEYKTNDIIQAKKEITPVFVIQIDYNLPVSEFINEVSTQTNRSKNQTAFLLNLLGEDRKKLTMLEEKIKKYNISYCPENIKEIELILNGK